MKKLFALFFSLLFALSGCVDSPAQAPATDSAPVQQAAQYVNGDAIIGTETIQPLEITDEGRYDSKEAVAFYLLSYGSLPLNYITKAQARERGWEAGSVETVAPGYCIGGDTFGNYEGALPASEGRTYTECDIGTLGMPSRGAKRIVFSNDGLIFYTDDHYKTFTLLLGEE